MDSMEGSEDWGDLDLCSSDLDELKSDTHSDLEFDLESDRKSDTNIDSTLPDYQETDESDLSDMKSDSSGSSHKGMLADSPQMSSSVNPSDTKDLYGNKTKVSGSGNPFPSQVKTSLKEQLSCTSQSMSPFTKREKEASPPHLSPSTLAQQLQQLSAKSRKLPQHPVSLQEHKQTSPATVTGASSSHRHKSTHIDINTAKASTSRSPNCELKKLQSSEAKVTTTGCASDKADHSLQDILCGMVRKQQRSTNMHDFSLKKEKVLLKDGGTIEDGKEYQVLDKQGNQLKMVLKNGVFLPVAKNNINPDGGKTKLTGSLEDPKPSTSLSKTYLDFRKDLLQRSRMLQKQVSHQQHNHSAPATVTSSNQSHKPTHVSTNTLIACIQKKLDELKKQQSSEAKVTTSGCASDKANDSPQGNISGMVREQQRSTNMHDFSLKKEKVLLKDGGTFEDGKEYRVRDKQGNQLKMVLKNGVFLPVAKNNINPDGGKTKVTGSAVDPKSSPSQSKKCLDLGKDFSQRSRMLQKPVSHQQQNRSAPATMTVASTNQSHKPTHVSTNTSTASMLRKLNIEFKKVQNSEAKVTSSGCASDKADHSRHDILSDLIKKFESSKELSGNPLKRKSEVLKDDGSFTEGREYMYQAWDKQGNPLKMVIKNGVPLPVAKNDISSQSLPDKTKTDEKTTSSSMNLHDKHKPSYYTQRLKMRQKLQMKTGEKNAKVTDKNNFADLVNSALKMVSSCSGIGDNSAGVMDQHGLEIKKRRTASPEVGWVGKGSDSSRMKSDAVPKTRPDKSFTSNQDDYEDDHKMIIDQDQTEDQNEKTVGLKKSLPIQYTATNFGKGKHSATGPTRIKSSNTKHSSQQANVTKSLPDSSKKVKRTVTFEPSVSHSNTFQNTITTQQTKTKEARVPSTKDLLVSLTCEACSLLKSHNSMVECCAGHTVCVSCVEKEAKRVITGAHKGSVPCSTSNCDSSIPQSELRKCLPSIVLDLLEESWKKETLEALENMTDSVKCPGCGYSGVLETTIKNFRCNKCEKTYCRLCEMEWQLKRHDLCVKMIKKVSEVNGQTISIPAHWDLDTEAEKEVGYTVAELNTGSEEFNTVFTMFFKSHMNNYNIQKIYRIQNQRLWEKYSMTRAHFVEDIGEMEIAERRVFHGTEYSVIDNISKEGFDWRLCGKHATVFGQGSYFAKDADYSARYSIPSDWIWLPPNQRQKGPSFPPAFVQSMRFNVLTGVPPSSPSAASSSTGLPAPNIISLQNLRAGFNPFQSTSSSTSPSGSSPNAVTSTSTIKHNSNYTHQVPTDPNKSMMYMFVARVLVGKTCQGKSDMRRPINGAHTAVDNTTSPRIFVVFDSGQCYPEYLIQYTKKSPV